MKNIIFTTFLQNKHSKIFANTGNTTCLISNFTKNRWTIFPPNFGNFDFRLFYYSQLRDNHVQNIYELKVSSTFSSSRGNFIRKSFIESLCESWHYHFKAFSSTSKLPPRDNTINFFFPKTFKIVLNYLIAGALLKLRI